MLVVYVLAAAGLVLPSGEPSAGNGKLQRVAQNAAHYRGTVSAIGDDWLELAPGWQGSDETKEKWMLENRKPRRLSAVGTTAGGDPNGDGSKVTYRITDLLVGDLVTVDSFIAANGEEWTNEILIYRRPGRKIPARPGEMLPDLNGWHLEMQAEQDWEEKGIPIPKKYLRNGRYPWTNPPYPPVAPLPREGKR